MNPTYWIYLFTSFHGRVNREPFWIACGILAAIEIVTQWLAYRIGGDSLSTILDLGLDRETEVRTLRAFTKLLWLQNDLVTRHYQAE